MRVFLIDLVASIVISIGLWEFGLARQIWPAHPYLATSLIVAVSCIVLQIVLKRDASEEKTKG